jgi:hypothetical protein
MFRIFFSGEKLAFLDFLPKGQNMDSWYFCNNFLKGDKAEAFVGTRKATLRDFHIHMDNCKVHNSKLMQGNWTRSRSFDATILHIHPILHSRTFGFSGGAKKRWSDKPFRVERWSKHFYSKSGQECIPVNFSAYLINGWRGLNTLSNRKENTILKRRFALIVCLFAKIKRGQLLFIHPILSLHAEWESFIGNWYEFWATGLKYLMERHRNRHSRSGHMDLRYRVSHPPMSIAL